MKISEIEQLAIPDIKVIRFSRFYDHRGYFTEHYRKSDFQTNPQTPFLQGIDFLQMNESFSNRGTFRGLHFQWNPYMGKLVRTLQGHMVDFILDIRKGSPTFGKIIAYDMPSDLGLRFAEWIWIPSGFAHGVMFLQNSVIEYLCTGEYSPGCEAGISPLAEDIDWSLCDPTIRETFLQIVPNTPLISDKDRNAFSLTAWARDERSNYFIYEMIESPVEVSY